MKQENRKYTGKWLIWEMQKVMIVTVILGAPVVMIFFVYSTGGGLKSLEANWLTFTWTLIWANAVTIFGVIIHAIYIKSKIGIVSEFLDNCGPRKNESDEQYKKRVTNALLCTLNFPKQGAGLSLVSWPSVLATVMIGIYYFFFKYPVELVLILVVAGFCIGVLVTNFQFYIFKRKLIPIQKYLLSFYPNYWKDRLFHVVRWSLGRKMMISLLSLMLMIVMILSIFSNLDAEKGLFLQWGKYEKTRILREFNLMKLSLNESTSVDELNNFIETIDDHSESRYFLLDGSGKNMLGKPIADSEAAVLSALVRRSHKIEDFMIVPFPADPDISFDLERGDLAVNALIQLPGTNLFLVVRQSYLQLIATSMRMLVGSFVVMIIALIVSISFSRTFMGEVLTPMKDVLNLIKKIGRGELVDEIDIVNDDEMGVLAVNFKSMILNLRDMINKIGGASSRIDDTSSRIISGFKKVSEGSQQQAKAVDETSTSVEQISASIKGVGENLELLASSMHESSASITEMSASIKGVADSVDELNQSAEETTSSIGEMATSIKQVADNVENLSRKAENTVSSVTEMDASIKTVQSGAEEAAHASEIVVSNAEEGKFQVQSTIESVNRAKKSSERAVTVIQELAVKAEEIGNIVTVIKDITDQTNLLALNAAIIAAQAGERGRGFAVVADEIKSLAERTAHSTGEINQLIGSVQHGAREAVDAVRAGYKIVEEGSTLSEKAGVSLDLILDSARQGTQRAREIAVATVDQAEQTKEVLLFFEEISDNIRQLEVATSEQSKGANQIMKSAEQMREITKQVKSATKEQYMGSRQIISAIESVNEIIRSINKSQNEQIGNGDRIVESVAGIHLVADQNEKDAMEMLRASSNLAALAEELRSMVGVFKLEDKKSKTS